MPDSLILISVFFLFFLLLRLERDLLANDPHRQPRTGVARCRLAMVTTLCCFTIQLCICHLFANTFLAVVCCCRRVFLFFSAGSMRYQCCCCVSGACIKRRRTPSSAGICAPCVCWRVSCDP